MGVKICIEPESRKEVIIQKMLEEFISTDRPVPPTLALGTKTVSIPDVRPDIIAFREQRLLLQRYGQLWPSVRLNSDPGNLDRAYWAPLDLSIYMPDVNFPEVVIADGSALLKSEKEAQQAGFITKKSSPDEMCKAFTDILGGVIHRRSSSTDDPNAGPPTDELTVTTNSHGVQVLYATGYFVSTQRGFGISTPVSRALPWGNYIFGYKKDNKVRFDDTLWTVPHDTKIHLQV